MQILYPDHGVYADGGSSALLSSRDQIDSDTICGICPSGVCHLILLNRYKFFDKNH
ncbi:hypothetical protein [Oribacterium sp. oral taxon 078]|uniref:hypothetical protein n=1 Tax=Oribacterium sp. oral taxon 078 TaxID=652706 RepID=UPI0001BCBAFE|nr:hypothetical protein [Oribacterium sp. oral taxon 078]